MTVVAAFLLFSSFSFSENPKNDSPARFVVHILDYLAKDYGISVSKGKIIDAFEYEEQVEFINEAIRQYHDLQVSSQNSGEKLEKLKSLISSKEDAAAVSRLAREIQAEIIKFTKLEVSPSQLPNLSHGALIYQKNCISCHGIRGDGNGPAASQLKPRPTSFRDPQIMDSMTPFQAFNTIRLGIPQTAMAPFHQFSDADVWDVAFYVVSLRHLDDTHTSLNNNRGFSSLPIAKSLLQEALEYYETGYPHLAKKKALAAYLDGIEPMETKLRANHPEAISDIEAQMIEVRKLIDAREPLAKLRASIDKTEGTIERIEKLLLEKPTSGSLTFLMSAGIIVREGFEAVLIIIALLSVLRATNAAAAARWVHGGWLTAIFAGLTAWFFSGWLMGMSGAQRETMEAVTSLLAVLVLLYLGFWLHRKTEIERWKAFIDDRIKSALGKGNLLALGMISFIAVFREAFETVLFLRAVWLEGGTETAMLSGVISAFMVVFASSFVFLKFSKRLPVRRLFGITSLIMVVLAIILTGKGLHALQETGILSISPSPIPFRFDLVGFYPTLETFLSQALVLILCVSIWFYTRQRSNRVKAFGA
jgi:high-affinity iron transporter